MAVSVSYFLSIEEQLNKNPDASTVKNKNEKADNQEPAPNSTKANSRTSETAAIEEKPKPPAPRKNLTDKALQRRLDSLPALPRRTVITGQPIPFEISIPAGWKILSWNNPIRATINHRSIINLEVGPWTTSLDEYTELTRKEMTRRFPLMKLAGEETITIDKKPWRHLVLRGEVTGAGEDHEVSILVYGSRRGSYRFIVDGDRNDLEQDANDITLMLTSFQFPPDNFEPEDVSDVRVYVDGERVIK